MASKTVKVGSSVGLHARPASIIADAAAEFDEDIFLALVGEEDDDETDAASSLMIMALGAEQGDEVTVTSENAEAVEKIASLIEQDLDAYALRRLKQLIGLWTFLLEEPQPFKRSWLSVRDTNINRSLLKNYSRHRDRHNLQKQVLQLLHFGCRALEKTHPKNYPACCSCRGG